MHDKSPHRSEGILSMNTYFGTTFSKNTIFRIDFVAELCYTIIVVTGYQAVTTWGLYQKASAPSVTSRRRYKLCQQVSANGIAIFYTEAMGNSMLYYCPYG